MVALEILGNGKKYCDVSVVKKRLSDFMDAEKYIDNQLERLEYLTSKISSVGSPELTDIPKSPNMSGDRMARDIAKKMELEAEIEGLIREQNRERKWIRGVLAHISKPNERSVIELRYIDGWSWKKVSEILFGSMPDYEEHEDSYISRTTKLHGRALVSMTVYINNTN